jgi:zinc transport system permease protein
MPVEWLSNLVFQIAEATGTYSFRVNGVIAVVLVCTLCGMVGSMVVGNRMAFFSDTMAHTAFAGVTLGYLSVILSGWDKSTVTWVVPLVMVATGVAAGVGMVYVRERTGLANDTVIGVFFALSIGLGAMLFQVLRVTSNFNPENFLFGNLTLVPVEDLLFLMALAVIVTPLYAWRYNQLVFGSFNPTLARTRGLTLHVNNYLFIVILALVVNLSIKAVGALLINAMLVVPAAAAANCSRNVRQMFWFTVAFSLVAGLIGFGLQYTIKVRVGPGEETQFGPSGLIVVTSVCLFLLSILGVAVWNRFAPVLGLTPLPRRPGAPHVHDETCSRDHSSGQCH